jgi:hypothetical protein
MLLNAAVDLLYKYQLVYNNYLLTLKLIIMKKQLLTLLFATGIAISGFGQSKADSSSVTKGGIKFSIGAETGLPVGQASQGYNLVLGGSAKVEVPTSPASYLTLTAGYNAFFAKGFLKNAGAPSTFGFVPLKAGLKVYTDNFFVEAQAGVVLSTENGGGHAFAWSPGIGYTFSKGFEFGARYEGWSNGGTVGQISARIAYRF